MSGSRGPRLRTLKVSSWPEGGSPDADQISIRVKEAFLRPVKQQLRLRSSGRAAGRSSWCFINLNIHKWCVINNMDHLCLSFWATFLLIDLQKYRWWTTWGLHEYEYISYVMQSIVSSFFGLFPSIHRIISFNLFLSLLINKELMMHHAFYYRSIFYLFISITTTWLLVFCRHLSLSWVGCWKRNMEIKRSDSHMLWIYQRTC